MAAPKKLTGCMTLQNNVIYGWEVGLTGRAAEILKLVPPVHYMHGNTSTHVRDEFGLPGSVCHTVLFS